MTRSLRNGGAARHPHGLDAVEPLLADLLGVVDTVRVLGAVLECNVDEPDAVRRVRGPDHDDEVRRRRDLLHRDLPVLRGVADVVRRRVLDGRVLLTQQPHRLHRLVDTERGLRQPDQVVGVRDVERGDVGRSVHQDRALRSVPHGALDLFVAGVTDEDDRALGLREACGFAMDLRHEGAGGVDGVQVALGRSGHHGRGDAVRAEDDVRPSGHLGHVVDEHGAALLEGGHHVDVVDDLLADVHGFAVLLERLLDRDDGPVDAGAVAARGREQDPLGPADREVTQSSARCGDPRRGERDRVAVGDRHVPDDR